MYESYWQLNQKPFDNTADPRFYYPDESRQSALLKLRYAIENRRGGALLSGVSGCGKTLLAGMLKQMLGEQYAPLVHLVFPQMPTTELLGYVADQLEGTQPGSTTAGVRVSVQRIERFLAGNVEQERHAVVIIDEAHLLEDARTFETLRLLLNFEPAERPGLTLVLSGQPALLPLLERLPQMEERLAVKCLLRPFNPQETAEYVQHRLKAAGATREIFPREALQALHALTHGVARQINRICDLSLLIGYGQSSRMINAASVEEALKTMGT